MTLEVHMRCPRVRVGVGMVLRHCTGNFLSPRRSAYITPHSSMSIFSRQMNMEAQSVAAHLNSSGFIRSQGLIGGKWTDAYDEKTIKVCNPATGEVITNVPCMGGKETNDAITSAYDAFVSWSKLTAADRSKCLRKCYDLILAHKEELEQLMTLEQGKPLKEAIGEPDIEVGVEDENHDEEEIPMIEELSPELKSVKFSSLKLYGTWNKVLDWFSRGVHESRHPFLFLGTNA
ncbi:Succinate-semialdehyde dehydrogenase [Abeliophyllum distichum]|uniref:Succinate-semialdehyde dehydrogenase n=1 Tax=Abeliophyllum distichum TaxID=126358 RepID=A0ABD1TVV4_9LAMI